MDMEKVIEAFDDAKELVWLDDDEYTVGYNDGIEAGKNITLAMLKEQEAVVHPEPSRGMIYITNCRCDSCGGYLIPEDNFCRGCGKRIEWEGR